MTHTTRNKHASKYCGTCVLSVLNQFLIDLNGSMWDCDFHILNAFNPIVEAEEGDILQAQQVAADWVKAASDSLT